MFEFHGWAVVESTSGRRVWRKDGLYQPDDDELHQDLEHEIEHLDEFSRRSVKFQRAINGMASLTVSGQLNHRKDSIFHLFEWLAENGKRSYGVLFTRDDEDNDRGFNPQTHFRVYRLNCGQFVELESLFEIPPNLSPYPVESEFDTLPEN